VVGSAIGGKLAELGHEVRMGSREAGNEKARAWSEAAGANASDGTFADAAAFGELVVNCTAGSTRSTRSSRPVATASPGRSCRRREHAGLLGRHAADARRLNTDSLGEQIQRAFPDSKVVKTLNTMNCDVMVDPGRLPGGHVVFVCGEDGDAKGRVVELLGSFGWPAGRIVDLGGIRAARGTEMYLPLWLSLYGALGTGDFNIALEHAETEH
jgi:predicted dinucleotide-binding enzyme